MYYTPCNEFVAALVGEPEINLVDGRLFAENGKYYVEVLEKGYLLPLPESSGIIRKLVDSGVNEYHIGFRPNNVRYTFEKKDGLLKGTVYSFESIGNKAVLIAKIGDKFVRMIAPNDLRSGWTRLSMWNCRSIKPYSSTRKPPGLSAPLMRLPYTGLCKSS